MSTLRSLLSMAFFVALSASPAEAVQGGGSDSCAQPQPISGLGVFNFDNTNATTGAAGQNEALCYAFGSSTVSSDVWFEWTSTFTGVATVSTCSLTAVDTKIAAYPQTPLAGCPQQNTSIACNDDLCGFQSEIGFAALSGGTYLLQIGTFPGSTPGAGQFEISTNQLPSGLNYGVVFSGDYKGPLHGGSDANGDLIRESDLLASGNGGPTSGNQTAPEVLISGADLGLQAFAQCGNPAPGVPCQVEVDAFSRGGDYRLFNDGRPGSGRIYFTVDEWARGISINPHSPSVTTEGASAAKEASADIFKLVEEVLPGPVPPPVPGNPWGNIAIIDGDGNRSESGYKYPGYGLKEPNAPTQGPLNQGSNADSINFYKPGSTEIDPVTVDNPAFFSLDGNLFDPFEGILGSNSAGANGQLKPGDVLISTGPTGTLSVYASSAALGLDQDPLVEKLDDIDALILWDNGDGVYQRADFPYQWVEGEFDMLIFSVRRGSPIIGTPDSIFGLPISEGDLLVPPVPGPPGVQGGSSAPGILVSAEAMGLRSGRDGTAADDLGGADTSEDPIIDCNGNGAEDSEDISNGTSDDYNANGVPDECEEFVQFCAGQQLPTALTCQCPCGNCDTVNADLAGCGNGSSASFNEGASLVGSGSTSVTATGADIFTLGATGLIPSQPGLYFQGVNAINSGSGNQFGDGLRCAGGSVVRLEVRFASSGGTSSTTADLVLRGGVSSGDLRRYQLWYRDPSSSPCGTQFNLTNGVQVLFTP